MGDRVNLTLAAEIMGRRSNLILYHEDGRIIDSIKRVGQEMSSVRMVLPGAQYTLPPREQRLNLLDCTKEELLAKIAENPTAELSKAIMKTLEGISPVFAREAVFFAARGAEITAEQLSGDTADRLWFYFSKVRDSINEAFKSLGFERLGKPGAPPFNTRVHKCYTHVPVSSYHSALHHAEGFAIDEKKFYPVGIPRTDIFFDDEYKAKTREQMLEVFPECKTAKTVYMYAPTFRGNNANNAHFPFDKLDLTAWGKFLDETDSVLIVKLHPFVKKAYRNT